jgi:hypothetical protein
MKDPISGGLAKLEGRNQSAFARIMENQRQGSSVGEKFFRQIFDAFNLTGLIKNVTCISAGSLIGKNDKGARKTMNAELQKRITDYEAVSIKKNFPQFKLFYGNADMPFACSGELFWGGRLTTNFGTEYGVAVVYPKNYPHGQIKAFVTELMEVSTKHKYTDGHLCLYSNDHGGGGEGIGAETTASTVIGWAAAWLNAYEIDKRTGRWPGKE